MIPCAPATFVKRVLKAPSNLGPETLIDSAPQAYLLQSLNLKGPGLLPVKGALIRKYPEAFTAARKIDSGEREGERVAVILPPLARSLAFLMFVCACISGLEGR